MPVNWLIISDMFINKFIINGFISNMFIIIIICFTKSYTTTFIYNTSLKPVLFIQFISIVGYRILTLIHVMIYICISISTKKLLNTGDSIDICLDKYRWNIFFNGLSALYRWDRYYCSSSHTSICLILILVKIEIHSIKHQYVLITTK